MNNMMLSSTSSLVIDRPRIAALRAPTTRAPSRGSTPPRRPDCSTSRRRSSAAWCSGSPCRRPRRCVQFARFASASFSSSVSDGAADAEQVIEMNRAAVRRLIADLARDGEPEVAALRDVVAIAEDVGHQLVPQPRGRRRADRPGAAWTRTRSRAATGRRPRTRLRRGRRAPRDAPAARRPSQTPGTCSASRG